MVYGKGDKERKAYFDTKTKIHLLNYIESRTDNNIALFVSLNKPHSRLTESGVELRLREMGKKLGVEKVHPHKFRRTMATRAIEKGRMTSGGRQLCADRNEAETADRTSTEDTWT